MCCETAAQQSTLEIRQHLAAAIMRVKLLTNEGCSDFIKASHVIWVPLKSRNHQCIYHLFSNKVNEDFLDESVK